MVADRTASLTGQPMFDILAEAKSRRDMVHFEIGDTEFSTPPQIFESAVTAIEYGETHYCESSGLPEFKDAIVKATLQSRGFLPDSSQILVTPGANIGIYYTALATLNPGDEVIMPDPYFPTYKGAFEFVGAKCVTYPLRGDASFAVNVADIAGAVTEKTKLIVVNSPQNPTGAVMGQEIIDQIYDIAEKADCYIFSDEVYSRSIYDGEFYSPSARDLCKKRVIVLNGFGKAFAMTGWRLGAMLGPSEVIEKMALFLQLTSSCVPPFVQRAGIAALNNPHVAEEMAWEYQSRGIDMVSRLNGIPGVRCGMPQGAFYAFPNIEDTGMDDVEFAARCMDAGVSVMPGSCFGECGKGHVRLCFAVGRDAIVLGVERIGDMVRKRPA